MWIGPENEFIASITIGSLCKEGKIIVFKMTLALMTGFITFSLFGAVLTKLLALFSMLKNWKY